MGNNQAKVIQTIDIESQEKITQHKITDFFKVKNIPETQNKIIEQLKQIRY